MPENNSLCASHLPSTEKKEKCYIFDKGRVRVPKRMIFWRSSRGDQGPFGIFPKIHPIWYSQSSLSAMYTKTGLNRTVWNHMFPVLTCLIQLKLWKTIIKFVGIMRTVKTTWRVWRPRGLVSAAIHLFLKIVMIFFHFVKSVCFYLIFISSAFLIHDFDQAYLILIKS